LTSFTTPLPPADFSNEKSLGNGGCLAFASHALSRGDVGFGKRRYRYHQMFVHSFIHSFSMSFIAFIDSIGAFAFSKF